jgi:hypothetical protein
MIPEGLVKKQIAVLEVEAERITEQEMSAAIARAKELVATSGLTLEHLHATVASKTRGVAGVSRVRRSFPTPKEKGPSRS